MSDGISRMYEQNDDINEQLYILVCDKLGFECEYKLDIQTGIDLKCKKPLTFPVYSDLGITHCLSFNIEIDNIKDPIISGEHEYLGKWVYFTRK